MLHSIREGVIALAPDGRVRLVNDEAARLLGLAPEAPATFTGRPLDAVLGTGRTADVLSGRVTGRDLVTVQAPGCWSPTACPPRTAAPSPPSATARSWNTSAGSSTPPAA